MKNNKTNLFVLPTKPIWTNSVVLARGGQCVIFDPASDVKFWTNWLDNQRLSPIAIYITHGHFDHVLSVADLTEKYNIPWYMNPADNAVLAGNSTFGRLFGAPSVKRPAAKYVSLPDGGDFELLPGLTAELIHTPGHTPGGMCFYIPDMKLLITGDTLFADTVGRTDIPMASSHKLMQSVDMLKSRDFTPDTHVIPGHGPDAQIADIRRFNPFFK